MDNKYLSYATKVINGEIVAGKLVTLACKRYLSWFERNDIEFRTDKVDRVVNFIHLLRHCDGAFRGKHFDLQDWQYFFICAVYGWYHKGTDKRVVHNAYLQLSRKCGKTALSSALCLYSMIADGEYGAEVYCVAPSRAQAAIAYRMATNYAETINRKGALKCLRNVIDYNKRKSFMKTFSPDAKFGDGFNPHFALLDEYHLFRDNDVLNALRSGMGARRNPIMMCITTAGRDLFCPCKEYRDMCVKLLNGDISDDTLFPLIYELDNDEEYKEPDCWKKCCPSLDITVTRDYLKERVVFAENNPTEFADVLTKQFNVWYDSVADGWIENKYIKRNSVKFELEDIIKNHPDEELEAFVALDLSSTRDMTAITAMIKTETKTYFKSWCVLPENQITAQSKNTSLYREAAQQGVLLLSPGDTVNYDYAIDIIVNIHRVITIAAIAYDRAFSHIIATKLSEDYGFNCLPYGQTLFNFSQPVKYFERDIFSSECTIIIDDNALVRWCFSNCILKEDNNKNCKPMKGKGPDGKIDPVITMLMALGTYMLQYGISISYSAFSVDKTN